MIPWVPSEQPAQRDRFAARPVDAWSAASIRPRVSARGAGFAEVHHLNPFASLRGTTVLTNPVTDVRSYTRTVTAWSTEERTARYRLISGVPSSGEIDRVMHRVLKGRPPTSAGMRGGCCVILLGGVRGLRRWRVCPENRRADPMIRPIRRSEAMSASSGTSPRGRLHATDSSAASAKRP
jgi:hypothetical protein